MNKQEALKFCAISFMNDFCLTEEDSLCEEIVDFHSQALFEDLKKFSVCPTGALMFIIQKYSFIFAKHFSKIIERVESNAEVTEADVLKEILKQCTISGAEVSRDRNG